MMCSYIQNKTGSKMVQDLAGCEISKSALGVLNLSEKQWLPRKQMAGKTYEPIILLYRAIKI